MKLDFSYEIFFPSLKVTKWQVTVSRLCMLLKHIRKERFRQKTQLQVFSTSNFIVFLHIWIINQTLHSLYFYKYNVLLTGFPSGWKKKIADQDSKLLFNYDVEAFFSPGRNKRLRAEF